MKLLPAAVVAVLVAASALSASPALAAAPTTTTTTAAVATAAPAAHPDIDPVTPPVEVTPSHPRVIESDPAVAGQSAATPNAPAPVGTSTITGTVSFADSTSVDGVSVTAFLFDAKGKQTFQSPSVITGADGAFSIPNLVAGEYWIEFEEHSNPAMPSWQWWGSDRLHPYGTSLAVADGEQKPIVWELSEMGGVLGTVTCATCEAAPDPSTVTVLVGAFDPASGLYDFIDSGHPAADGSYGFNSLFPSDDYLMFARYTGSGPFNTYSNSTVFTMEANAYASSDVIVTRHVDPVSGIKRSVNSNVNALYWDYLTRLPSSSDVSFWGTQIQAGANLNIVAAGFVMSDEYRYIRIDAAYRTILGREPEPAGRLNWLNGMKAGILTTDDIETSFYASDEYYLQHGNSNTGFMQALYQTLLGRDGTPSDYDFWSNLVVEHGRAWVIDQFWDSNETISQRVSAMYTLYLGRAPDAAGLANWVGIALQIGDSGLRAGLSGSDEYFIRSQFRFRES